MVRNGEGVFLAENQQTTEHSTLLAVFWHIGSPGTVCQGMGLKTRPERGEGQASLCRQGATEISFLGMLHGLLSCRRFRGCVELQVVRLVGRWVSDLGV